MRSYKKWMKLLGGFFCDTPSPRDQLTEVRAKLRVSPIPCPRNSRANAINYARGRSVNKRRGPRVRRRQGPATTRSREETAAEEYIIGYHCHFISQPRLSGGGGRWGWRRGKGGGASTHGKSTVNLKQLLIGLQLFDPHHKPGD